MNEYESIRKTRPNFRGSSGTFAVYTGVSVAAGVSGVDVFFGGKQKVYQFRPERRERA